MATYNKFYNFPLHFAQRVHDWDNDTFRIALTNVVPNPSDIEYSPSVYYPPTTGADYPDMGCITTVSSELSLTTHEFKLYGTECVFSAATDDIGPFRFAVLYNETSPQLPGAMISWWDYGRVLTITRGTPFSIKFGNAGVIFRFG